MEKQKPAPLTPAARKSAEKARKEALGLIRYPVWIPDTPEAKAAIRELANRLRE